ncbi:hypothetical protein ACWD7F_39420 [Streptomyces sp. NPDC005122]
MNTAKKVALLLVAAAMATGTAAGGAVADAGAESAVVKSPVWPPATSFRTP